MQSVKNVVLSEPIGFWSTLHLAINIVQLAAISMPTWLHIVIVIASGIASAMAARRQVTPTKAPSSS